MRDWRGHSVVDPEGAKIGELEAVYYDTATDEPSFVSIQLGLLDRHRLVFAPLAGATVAPDFLRVAFPKKLVKDAPAIDPDGELEAGAEPALFEHYGIEYTPGATGERRLARR